MLDIPATLTAVAAVLVPLGGGIGFVWSKVDAARSQREARLLKIEGELEECRDHRAKSMERRAKQLTVIELLWLELERIAPDAKVFSRVKKLLDELKPKEG